MGEPEGGAPSCFLRTPGAALSNSDWDHECILASLPLAGAPEGATRGLLGRNGLVDGVELRVGAFGSVEVVESV